MRASFVLLPVLLAILAISLIGCDDDGSGVQTQGPDQPGKLDTNQQQVLIINEGTFNQGNASLGIYNPDADTLRIGVFEKQTGRPLGDVFQSVTVARQKILLVINNSGKIEVLDSSTLESRGVIRGLPSPRHVQLLENGRAYVTNFTKEGSSVINIVDLDGQQVLDEITTGGWTGNPVLVDGEVWVPEVKPGWLLVIDPVDNRITDTVKLRPEVKKVVRDAEGQLWALANGGIDNSETPALYRINPSQKSVALQLVFNKQNISPSNLTLNGSRDTLFYVQNGIYKLPIQGQALPDQPLIQAKDRTFYGIGVDPGKSTIYAADAEDFVRRGEVFRFDDQDGRLLSQFKAGIIPAGFVFL